MQIYNLEKIDSNFENYDEKRMYILKQVNLTVMSESKKCTTVYKILLYNITIGKCINECCW